MPRPVRQGERGAGDHVAPRLRQLLRPREPAGALRLRQRARASTASGAPFVTARTRRPAAHDRLAPPLLGEGEGGERARPAGRRFRQRGVERHVQRVPVSRREASAAQASSSASVTPSAGSRRATRRRPSVSVPVLSEQMQDTRPMFSTDGPAHQGLPARQAVHADAEEEGEDDGELLREGRDGERHRAHQRVDPAVALPPAHEGEHQAQRHGRRHEHRHELRDGGLQRRARAALARGAGGRSRRRASRGR